MKYLARRKTVERDFSSAIVCVALMLRLGQRVSRNPAPIPVVLDDALSPRMSLAMLTLCVCVALIAVFACNVIYERRIAIETAAQAADNLAASLAQQASDAFEAVDNVLIGAAGRVNDDGTGPVALAALHDSLGAQMRNMPRLHALFVVGARGEHIVDNESIAPRPDLRYERASFFMYHRDHAIAHVHISGPRWNAVEKAWIIYVSRRIDRSDGRFGGVVVAEITTDYFDEFYRTFDIGQHGVIALTADDGTVIVRKPVMRIGGNVKFAPMFGEPYIHLTSGHYLSVSRTDGVLRLFAFKRLGLFPVVADVGVSEQEYLADWQSMALKNGVALGLVILIIGGLAASLDTQIRSRRSAETSLAQLALIDGLTGIPNRRHFDAVFDREWRHAGREHEPVALLMIDVDEFKAYNDHYGHQKGDEILILIAATITDNIFRASDFCARYGGEEFGVILPATDTSSATAIGDRIRLAVLELGVEHAASKSRVVSVSVGVCSVIPEHADNSAELIAAADTALYLAKHSGRNGTAVVAGLNLMPDLQPASTEDG